MFPIISYGQSILQASTLVAAFAINSADLWV